MRILSALAALLLGASAASAVDIVLLVKPRPSTHSPSLALETGDVLLLETGDRVLLE